MQRSFILTNIIKYVWICILRHLDCLILFHRSRDFMILQNSFLNQILHLNCIFLQEFYEGVNCRLLSRCFKRNFLNWSSLELIERRNLKWFVIWLADLFCILKTITENTKTYLLTTFSVKTLVTGQNYFNIDVILLSGISIVFIWLYKHDSFE